ncbi:MAG TPA: hypothetical protein VG370_13500 [Chloroflexota bacterium]|jgi:hypothetical protein|nr:hypothetical protein [Chloroflexota bacterium]
MQIRDFPAAVREDREPAVTGEEGRKTVEITEAMYRSGRTRAPIGFPVPADGGAADRAAVPRRGATG